MKYSLIIIAILAVLAIALAGCAESELQGDALKQSLEGKYCKSSEPYQDTVLGYLEQKDEILNQWYAVIVCKEKNLNTGNFEVKIRSDIITGTSLDENSALEFSKKAELEGKNYFIRGDPFTPEGKLDKRRIEYRFYQENGIPQSIEVFMVLRNSDRTAKPEKTLSIDWPAS